MKSKYLYYCILTTLTGLGATGCQLLIPDETGGAGATGTATHTSSSNASSTTGEPTVSSSSSTGGGVTCPNDTDCTKYCTAYQASCSDALYDAAGSCCATCAQIKAADTSNFVSCITTNASNQHCPEANPIAAINACMPNSKDAYCNLRSALCGDGGNCNLPGDPTVLACSVEDLVLIATAKSRAKGLKAGVCNAQVTAICNDVAGTSASSHPCNDTPATLDTTCN